MYVPTNFQRALAEERIPIIVRPPYPAPSPWTISVMTMLSYLSTPVDLRSVFYCVDVVDFGESELTAEQLEDWKNAKAEVGCEGVLTQKRGICRRCIATECGCLAAFFPGILDIHYRNFCRGNAEFAEVKANKRGRPAVRTFENQCTMRICMSRNLEGYQQKNGQQWNIVNLKMFSNGKIQMTGCKSLDQARGAVQFLLQKLMEKAPAMRAKRDCMTQLRCFGMDANDLPPEVLRQIQLSQLTIPTSNGHSMKELPRDAMFLVLLHVDNESLFACRRVSRMFRAIVESEQFWTVKTARELRCVVEKHEERQTWYMTSKFNGRFNRMERVKNAEHYQHPKLLYQRYSARALRRHKAFLVVEQYEDLFVAGEQIVMINSDFCAGFEINLPALFKILLHEYQPSNSNNNNAQQGKIVNCAYSPDDYAALNVKYESPIRVQSIDDDEGTNSGDQGTIISFFVFRTGSVIINSARSMEQEIDAYNFINGVFQEHYDRIWNSSRSDQVDSKQHKRRKKE